MIEPVNNAPAWTWIQPQDPAPCNETKRLQVAANGQRVLYAFLRADNDAGESHGWFPADIILECLRDYAQGEKLTLISLITVILTKFYSHFLAWKSHKQSWLYYEALIKGKLEVFLAQGFSFK